MASGRVPTVHWPSHTPWTMSPCYGHWSAKQCLHYRRWFFGVALVYLCALSKEVIPVIDCLSKAYSRLIITNFTVHSPCNCCLPRLGLVSYVHPWALICRYCSARHWCLDPSPPTSRPSVQAPTATATVQVSILQSPAHLRSEWVEFSIPRNRQ